MASIGHSTRGYIYVKTRLLVLVWDGTQGMLLGYAWHVLKIATVRTPAAILLVNLDFFAAICVRYIWHRYLE